MRYISTRGTAPVLEFSDVLLTGLATDGGLYVPESFPTITPEQLQKYATMNYCDVAVDVMMPYVDIPRDDFAKLVHDAYSTFSTDEIVPLKKLSDGTYMLELFHGPTLAFKDVALQLLGRLFDYVLTKRGERVTIVGATSGDTGSAAISACENRSAIDIFILHPQGRTSDVQRKQMTTVTAPNVHNIALQGTFDDCQDVVKAMFNDTEFRNRINLSAVNSINWARIMAQVVYYVYASAKIGADKTLTVSVPTGNFGNVYASYVAQRMGVPIKQFIVASNANDILTRFFQKNDMSVQGVNPTLSPSMDIQISSNFERLLFDLLGRDGSAVATAMQDFRTTGKLPLSDKAWQQATALFAGYRLDDDGTLNAMKIAHETDNELVDPHSVIGLSAVHNTETTGDAVVVAATAHPAKFPHAVQQATGVHPDLPPHLADLFDRDEKYDVLPNHMAEIQAYIIARI